MQGGQEATVVVVEMFCSKGSILLLGSLNTVTSCCSHLFQHFAPNKLLQNFFVKHNLRTSQISFAKPKV
eukprot:300368-Amphidinium_carterae.1